MLLLTDFPCNKYECIDSFCFVEDYTCLQLCDENGKNILGRILDLDCGKYIIKKLSKFLLLIYM